MPRDWLNVISPNLFRICIILRAMGRFRLCSLCARSLGHQRRPYSSQNGPRDYNAAVAALNTLQSNFSIVEDIKKRGPGWNKRAVPEMREWIRKIGDEVCVTDENL